MSIGEKIVSIFQTLYSEIGVIVTATAVFFIAVCLVMIMFSGKSKGVENAVSWIKRIAVSWIVFNMLGAIVTFAESSFNEQYDMGAAGGSASTSVNGGYQNPDTYSIDFLEVDE